MIYHVSYVTGFKKDEQVAKTVHLSKNLQTTYCGHELSDRWYNHGCIEDSGLPPVTCRKCLKSLA